MADEPITVVPSNPKLYVTGAVSTFVYACTGTDSYVLSVPIAHEVLGIFANFGSDATIAADSYIVCNKSAKTVKVLTAAGTLKGGDVTLQAMVVAKKAGGVA